MKRVPILFLSFLLFCYSVNAQQAAKPIIDSIAIANWPTLGRPSITNDGAYFLYSIENQPVGSRTLIVQATKGLWKKEFVGVSAGVFTADSKQVIYQRNDSLFFQQLGGEGQQVIAHFRSHSESQRGTGHWKWLAYQLKSKPDELIVRDMGTGREQQFPDLASYQFDKEYKSLLITKKIAGEQSLELVQLSGGKQTKIWSGPSAAELSNISFDVMGNQILFVITGKGDKSGNSVWLYKPGMEKAEKRLTNQTVGLDPGMTISSAKFSESGDYIFLELLPPAETRKANPKAVKVNIWSYKDADIQPEQQRLAQSGQQPTYTDVFSINGGTVIKLAEPGERIYTDGGDYAVVRNIATEPWWKWLPQPSFYLVFLKDGIKRLIKKESNTLDDFSFSPDKQWLIYYDSERSAYFSCSTSSGVIKNISRKIPGGIAKMTDAVLKEPIAPVVGWLSDGKSLLLCNDYDVWQVDPSLKVPPISITHGYGKQQKVKLRPVYGYEGPSHRDIFKSGDSLLLVGFSPVTKRNGFYHQVLGSKSRPECLTLNDCLYYRAGSQKDHSYAFDDGMQPLKANDANAWIIKRQTASEAPNYFSTNNFKSYQPLTDLHPQKEYNWIKSELVGWKMFNGRMSQGVLYKPENFDPHKKYPVIFNYYEQLSHRLDEFPAPEFTGTNINIPWFVSRGYLVFTPDIFYEVAGKSNKTVGEWAYNSVVSAAQYLATLPFVDGKKMAIQGHSFGGLETSYLVTHSHLFAAAAEAAGSTDPISAYLTLAPVYSPIEATSKQNLMENAHELYGATPWQRPDLYQRNSAVLHADQVTTPLLIMHNEKDNSVQWRQGIEFYMALRRLGKTAWMLQYDNGHHGVNDEDAVDYTIRLTQFFDYYLKDAPPPVWMTKGVPYKLKGIETGYKLDLSGAKPLK